MQTPEFLSILNPISNWVSNHKTILGVLTVIFASAFNYFAKAEDLIQLSAKVEKNTEETIKNARDIEIDRLTYLIDLLSPTKDEDIKPATKRALENLIKEKDSLITRNRT